ncbi:hypothetical protein ElyMa_003359900 [Elysia marginata]|uniref:DDE Tnp4 domain-containing protein n=1 Tax=Elysia marginata TaxID=1093978 RepID=A0AAV4JKM8_9GAST|nr:hypothetical protein ElyMa_003359900 [Elysia marginata]
MFEDNWHFPNCLGSVDGKHIEIVPPPESRSFYYNYKGFHSIDLMAIANANYELLYAHFGTNERISDGGVIEYTGFHNLLTNNLLHLPGINPTNGLPYVFVSDEAFALGENFLKPYSVKMLDHDKIVFNYRLSRARRVVENVFGILVARIGVLQKKINLSPGNIDIVVMTCCVLHNFLRRHATSTYTPQSQLILKMKTLMKFDMAIGLKEKMLPASQWDTQEIQLRQQSLSETSSKPFSILLKAECYGRKITCKSSEVEKRMLE